MKRNQYLTAASEILAKVGRPMHYESIADLAIKLGLLKTRCKTPHTAMRTQLNRDIAENPNSNFFRKAPGIYKARGLLVPTWVFTLISNLQKNLGMQNRVAVLRRSLHLYRRILDLFEDEKHVRMIGDIREIDIQELSVTAITECVDQLDGDTLFYWLLIALENQKVECLELTSDLRNLSIKLQGRGGHKSISEVFQLCILLIEIAYKLISNSGAIQLCGSTGFIYVPIINKQIEN